MSLPTTTPTEPLDIIGTPSAVPQGDKRQWSYQDGESLTLTWRGRNVEIAALYQLLQAVAGSNPSYDSLDMDLGRGAGTLTARMVDDSAAVYELYSNEEQVPIQQAPYYDSLTRAEVADVTDARRKGAIAAVDAWSDLQDSLFFSLCNGNHYYIRSVYVLRETKTVSKRSTLSASYSNVNRREDPPDTSAVNTLIGPLPEGEWLKKSPNVQRLGKRKWTITQEWWWAPKWHVMYGGTYDPMA